MLRSTLLTLLSFPLLVFSQVWSNHTVAYSDVKGTSPYQRHECAAGLCQFGGNDYCIVVGGRGNFNKKCPIIYDRAKDSLYLGNQCPQEVHHFQASVWRDSIIVVGMALTNGYPGENPVSSLYLYHAKTDTWEVKTTIPTSRRRGSAQSVIVGDWVYFFNGITQGHISGWVNQADRYNLTTNTWEVLLPTPRARDHALAFHVGENIYLVGGRRSNYGNAGGLHGLPVFETDVFNLTTQTWSTLPASANIPSLRAGLLGAAQLNEEGNTQLNIWGGEYSGGTYATGLGLDLASNTWISIPSLPTTLHATQLIQISDDTLFAMAGATNTGMEVPLTSASYTIHYEALPVSFPISFVSFQGFLEQEGQLTRLYWQVNEEQIQTYEILRRESGRSQTILLGSKSSLGDGAHSYEFVDEFPPTDAQELSYQIRAIDFNGAISYSPVVLISAQAEPVRLYPSLISGEDHTLHIRGGVARTLSLFTTEGRMVWSGSINSDSWNVPMELAQGLYLLKVSLTDGSTVTGKLMIAE